VHVIAAGHRSDLAGRKESRHSADRKLLFEYGDIVVGAREHLRSTTIAREEQRAFNDVDGRIPELTQHPPQVVIGRVGITHLELHRPPDRHEIADDDPATLGVDAGDAAHQKVTGAVLVGVLIHGNPDL
jgi:hypothetical protein